MAGISWTFRRFMVKAQTHLDPGFLAGDNAIQCFGIRSLDPAKAIVDILQAIQTDPHIGEPHTFQIPGQGGADQRTIGGVTARIPFETAYSASSVRFLPDKGSPPEKSTTGEPNPASHL